MTISRLGHFVRVVLFSGAAATVEALTSHGNTIAHAAWVPAALLVARWLVAELDRAQNGATGGNG